MEKQQIGFQTITKKVATNIHEFLYSGVKLADQDKATLIAGILIALENDTFRNTYRNMTDADQFIDSFMSAIKHSILRYKGLQNEKETVISTFDFIGKNPNFKTSLENNGKVYITLQFLTEILEKSIYKIAKLNPSYDILGEFYNEFTKYSGADQQSLGIVLTPKHVAHFMAELLEVTEEDVLVDTCIGTGSLVLTADMETGTSNKILGVEFNARMLSLAVANMMIRGIDSHLILGDSYSEKILENLAAQKPTKLIINPPYAQDGYPELGFVKKGLDILQPNGLGVVILPTSEAINSSTATKKLKQEILESHSLLAVFTMPVRLFYPVAVHTTVMLFKAHQKNINKTFFYSLEDDGFQVLKGQGRVDKYNKWFKIKEEVISSFKNLKNKPGVCITNQVTSKDEWLAEAYMETDYSKISEKDFTKKIRNYILYNMSNTNLDENIDEIDQIFNILELYPDLSKPKNENKIDLKIENWRSFNIVELFSTHRGSGPASKLAKDNPGETPYIGSSMYKNGITTYTSFEPNEKENTITIAGDGVGVGSAFYQNKKYTALTNVNVLEGKFTLNPFVAMFIISIIELEKYKFNYGRKMGAQRLNNIKISLPVDQKGNPDWQLMEDYIKSLPYSKYL